MVEALLVAGADPCLLWGGCTPRQMLQGLLKQGKLNEPYRYFAFYAGKSRIDKDFVVEALKVRRGKGPHCVLFVTVHVCSLVLVCCLACSC